MKKRTILRGLFSGVQAAGLRAATYGSVRIGLCEPLQAQLGNKSAGALAAGVLATVVGNPFEVLKVRLQARPGAMGELQLLRSMLQEETRPSMLSASSHGLAKRHSGEYCTVPASGRLCGLWQGIWLGSYAICTADCQPSCSICSSLASSCACSQIGMHLSSQASAKSALQKSGVPEGPPKSSADLV